MSDKLKQLCPICFGLGAVQVDGSKCKTCNGEGHVTTGGSAALAQPQNDAEASRHGVHLFETAKSLGWKDDGESPLNFIARHERQRGIDTAPPSPERMREALERILLLTRKSSLTNDERVQDIHGFVQEQLEALSRAGDNHDGGTETDDLPAIRTANDWDKTHWERDNHASEPIIGGTALCGHGVMAAICAKCNHASDGNESEGLSFSSLPSGESDLPVTAGYGPSDPIPPDREAIARIIDPTARFEDIEGVTWSRFEIDRRELARSKADRILALRWGE